MFMLCELHRVSAIGVALDNAKGSVGQLAEDSVTGNVYVKHGGVWQQLTANGALGGNAAQAAATAVITNGQAVVIKNHAGAVSSGNAGLNSAGSVANCAAGALTSVTAGA